MNSFISSINNQQNYMRTENGALAYKSTNSALYDLFAFGGAYRNRSDEDVITLFSNALHENELYALKCLFYLRDVRGGGQGERRFFRTAYRWLCINHIDIALRNVALIPEYGRWDDLIYICEGTPAEKIAFNIIEKQLLLDTKCKTPSLLAKWMPSENASSKETARVANKLRSSLSLNHKQYRKILSELRTRIKVVEKLMSTNQWDQIEFDKIPSKAGLIYKNAFARRDLIKAKYESFIKDKTTKVNAATLYPYEIVEKALKAYHYNMENSERVAIEKYWDNLPDYFNGSTHSILPVVDTSGSMYGTPINVAIGLGMYAAERNRGAFKDHYISFASRPQLIHIEGADLTDKIMRIYRTNLCDNTNLEAVFDLLLNMIISGKAKAEDLPDTIVVISDMQIDVGTRSWNWSRDKSSSYWTTESAATEMEKIRNGWLRYGIKMPKLVYWNVDARDNTILDSGPDVSFVSGFSPVLFEQVVSGKTGVDLMMDKLNSNRYMAIT